MNAFTFRTSHSILVEAGSSARIGALCADLGCRSVLLVTDKGVRDAGLIDAALEGLKASGIAVKIYSDVQADPPEHIVMAAVNAACECGADGVVGLGGGSSLDVAKLVACLRGGTQTLEEMYGVDRAKGPRLPLVLAPTTAGTGSEVTPISIVTTGEEEKKGVVAPPLLPDWAVLDANLTMNLPPHVTAATGVDAMVHAIEAFTSRRLKNPVSDSLALAALRLLGSNIDAACLGKADAEVRQNMLLGATLAGMAFANAPVAAVHALAYPVGARFHVAHGLSNALVLPHVIAFNAPAAEALYAELAAVLVPSGTGTAGEKTAQLARWLADLTRSLGLQTHLREVGISHYDLPRLAEDAMKQQRLLINNPRDVSYDDALAIYQAAL